MSNSAAEPKILKWIRCSVEPGQRPAFDRAQRAWSSLSSVPGFLFQTGGWDSLHPGEAGILAGWQSMTHYRAFMDQVHDAITSASRQEQTYTRLRTRLFALSGAGADRMREGTRRVASTPSLRITLLRSKGALEAPSPGASEGFSLLASTLEKSGPEVSAFSSSAPGEFLLCHVPTTMGLENPEPTVNSSGAESPLPTSEILHDSRLLIAPQWVVTSGD